VIRQSGLARGMHTVSLFEAAKGALVLAAGFSLLSLVHGDVQAAAENLVRHLHLNPSRHYPRIFIDAASHFDDTRLRALAAFAFVYATVRFAEAYGLWYRRIWAEWFAIVSGAIYLPVEAYEIWMHATWLKVAVFLINTAIVAFVAYVRVLTRPARGVPLPPVQDQT
jgi:uncharacterized membrane protein (DUF2068 family)